jgi:hypothetical protein
VHELDDLDNSSIDPQLLSTATIEKLDAFRYTGNLGHISQEHSSIKHVHDPSLHQMSAAVEPYDESMGHDPSLHQMSAAVEPYDESMGPDPRDSAQLAQLASIIHGAVPSEEMEAFMDPLLENEDKCDKLKLITEVSSLEFIKKMSQINIVCHQSGASYTDTVTGGSRDEPSRFLYSCPNAVHGCENVMERTEQVRLHMIYCKSTSPEAHAAEQRRVEALDAKRTWVCDECGKSYGTKRALTNHQSVHTWIPKTCETEGCTSKNLFKSPASYRHHQVDAHSWTPCTCPVDGCKDPAHVFVTRGNLQRHLRDTHGLRSEEIAGHIPGSRSHRTWVPMKCLVSNCASTNLFKTVRTYRAHLRNMHKLSSIDEYMPF